MTRVTALFGAIFTAALIGLFTTPTARAQDTATGSPAIIEMTEGDENAPVQIYEYASFTCPHCAKFHEGPYKKLKAEYIDTGKVRLIYRDVYFDKYGLWASMVARCGGPDKFFGMADLIYKTQSEWVRAGGPTEIVGELRKIGRLAGLDDAQLDACLSDADKARALVGWYQENATRDGIDSTPTFIINGEVVSNRAWEDFKAIIDAELEG